MPTTGPDELTGPQHSRLVELCRRLEAGWRAGQPPLIEKLLEEAPEIDQGILLRDLLALDLQFRRGGGTTPRPADYRARFPGQDELIASLFHEIGESGSTASLVGRTSGNGIRPGDSTRRAAATVTISMIGTTGAATFHPSAETPDLPDKIGRYKVLGVLGEGGFGRVFLALDEELQRRVAIKVPSPARSESPPDVAAFLVEARILASLDHPNIVPVFDFGRTDDGLCYVVSKLIEGSDLAGGLRHGSLSHREAAELVATLADALHYAHARRLVHRDVKPRNILIEAKGCPYLADFGLALREEDFGKGPAFAGTIAYMSPEQARGEGHLVDGRSDIFSLSVVFYELLTGTRPFHGDSQYETLEQIKTLEARPPRQSDDRIPRELERICLKGLSKRVVDRYATALDMAEELRQAVAGLREGGTATVSYSSPPPSGAAGDSGALPDIIVPRGLRAFEAEDADFFLSLLPGPRDRHGHPESIRFWKSRIEEDRGEKSLRIGLVYGPSGCGKSSLIRAGLLPRLDDRIVSVIVEAVPDETEAQVLTGVRRRVPGLPLELDLPRFLAQVRRGHGLATGRKLLIVIDQFEQWLHAHPVHEQTGLIEALRQCDGARVQSLLIVRDDFWMSVTQFLQELDVRLAEGQNSAPVDLFHPRHAAKVLTAFGRAFEALPASPAELSREQAAFIEQAVSALAVGGKVVPVQLSLFAEMVRGGKWSPATLRQIGGTSRVGEAFLEEQFGGPTAPPHHRLHQRAAREVLKSLLPAHDSEIKGHRRPRRDLLAASGYGTRPRDFHDLLLILDNDLRLITPIDRDPSRTDGDGTRPHDLEPHYQLTHDYLVPALRSWLSMKQRETARGRAELRLEERAARWTSRKERRNLPPLWEYLCALLLVRYRRWTRPERELIAAAGKYHAMRGSILAAVLLALWVGVSEAQGRIRAGFLLDRIIDAKTEDVPGIVRQTGPYRRWLVPRLHAAVTAAEQASDRRKLLQANMALLPFEPARADVLAGALLEVDPRDFLTLRAYLGPHRGRLALGLWGLALDPAEPTGRRFRSACALADFDTDDPRWEVIAAEVAEQLTAENPVSVALWIEVLRPVREKLVPTLRTIFHDPERSEQRYVASSVLSSYLADEPAALVSLALQADPRQLSALKPGLRDAPEKVGELLEQAGLPAPGNLGDKRAAEAAAKQRANAAIVLLELGRDELVWPLLATAPDPRLRTYLIHRFGPAGLDPRLLIARLNDEREPSVRRAILRGLAGYELHAITLRDRRELARRLNTVYRVDPDPGTHSAVDALLRRWGSDQELRGIDRETTGPGPSQRQGWFTNRQGHTLAVIPGPAEAVVRGQNDQPHRIVIPRGFAVSTREVTAGQYRKYLQARGLALSGPPEDERPMDSVTWFEAAAYCRWISEREGIAEDQMCYPPFDQIGPGMRLPPDYLQRTGYRLPTEPEWVCSCQAGATTERFYGSEDDLIIYYGWTMYNANGHSWPVGRLAPNDFGLFDVIGNVYEWCDGPARSFENAQPNQVLVDDAGELILTGDRNHVLRGGAFDSRIALLTNGYRNLNTPLLKSPSVGFRIARTCK